MLGLHFRVVFLDDLGQHLFLCAPGESSHRLQSPGLQGLFIGVFPTVSPKYSARHGQVLCPEIDRLHDLQQSYSTPCVIRA